MMTTFISAHSDQANDRKLYPISNIHLTTDKTAGRLIHCKTCKNLYKLLILQSLRSALLSWLYCEKTCSEPLDDELNISMILIDRQSLEDIETRCKWQRFRVLMTLAS